RRDAPPDARLQEGPPVSDRIRGVPGGREEDLHDPLVRGPLHPRPPPDAGLRPRTPPGRPPGRHRRRDRGPRSDPHGAADDPHRNDWTYSVGTGGRASPPPPGRLIQNHAGPDRASPGGHGPSEDLPSGDPFRHWSARRSDVL